MRRSLLSVVLLVVGIGLMANPLYLPVAVADPSDAYVHTVSPVDSGIPEYDESDIVAYQELPAAGQNAFDRALSDPERTHVVEAPAERVEGFDYPAQPELGHGLTIVSREGTEYALWTYSVEREATPVVVQRVVLQPVLFLLGFFAVFGAAAVALKDRLSG